MSNEPKPRSDLNRVRKQKILVVVLLLGLGVALWKQPEEESDLAETSAPTANPVKLSLHASETPIGLPPLPDSFIAEDHLPIRSLSDISDVDLFLPETLTQQPPAAMAAPVVAVYGTSSSRTALVGEKTIVKPGQSLPSLGRVVEVDRDGIHVKP